MDKEAIFAVIKDTMISEFRLEPDSISPEKRLSEDLELDSLDAVDLILNLNDHFETKIDPSLFKEAKKIQDLVDLLHPLWK